MPDSEGSSDSAAAEIKKCVRSGALMTEKPEAPAFLCRVRVDQRICSPYRIETGSSYFLMKRLPDESRKNFAPRVIRPESLRLSASRRALRQYSSEKIVPEAAEFTAVFCLILIRAVFLTAKESEAQESSASDVRDFQSNIYIWENHEKSGKKKKKCLTKRQVMDYNTYRS